MKFGLTAFLPPFLLVLCPLAGSSQPGPGGEDPLARYLFAPDRVMSHGLEIGLEDSQKTAIKGEVQKAQSKFLDVQFELQGQMEKMIHLLQEKTVDETRVLGQLDRILALEKEIKTTQIRLLVRIRNLLTPAQQARLEEIQRAAGK